MHSKFSLNEKFPKELYNMAPDILMFEVLGKIIEFHLMYVK